MWKIFERDHDIVTGLTYAEFTRRLTRAGIRKGSRSHADYEQAKQIIYSIAESDGEAATLRRWAAQWVGV